MKLKKFNELFNKIIIECCNNNIQNKKIKYIFKEVFKNFFLFILINNY